jgi:hypothetical protein
MIYAYWKLESQVNLADQVQRQSVESAEVEIFLARHV